MKVTTTKVSASETGHLPVTEVRVNGVRIGYHTKGHDLYCTVKNGTPSRLRTRSRVAHRWAWDYTGLETVFGVEGSLRFRRANNVEGPDLKWGFTGAYHTAASIREAIAAHLEVVPA